MGFLEHWQQNVLGSVHNHEEGYRTAYCQGCEDEWDWHYGRPSRWARIKQWFRP